VQRADGAALLRVIFSVTLPAVLLTTFATLPLDAGRKSSIAWLGFPTIIYHRNISLARNAAVVRPPIAGGSSTTFRKLAVRSATSAVEISAMGSRSFSGSPAARSMNPFRAWLSF
jgi:hypothetical protein